VETFTKYLAVAAGSALGGVLRYYVGGSVLSRIATPFPFATFIVNISGSFVIGFFLTLAAERVNISPHLRLAIAVGFVGAYTTFSTFEYETARLIEEQRWMLALLNIVLSVVVGFVAVMGGIFAARKLEGLPLTSSNAYIKFEQLADASDPPQMSGAERDIRDASIVRKEFDE
jgi:CrcB protein